MTSNPKPNTTKIKAICFDFMGTCLDWHSSITSALPSSLPPSTKSEFALSWRQRYFDANTARLSSGLPPENIDLTHRRTLDELLLTSYPDLIPHFPDSVRDSAVKAWHSQKAWPDVLPTLQRLRQQGYEVYVHANGTTRLQLDLVKSAGLRGMFDMLFSSELLGVYKPDPGNYLRFLELVDRKAEECVLVAAHAYDVRGAREVGMRTVYVYRWTDDVEEDQEVLRTKEGFDAYLAEGGMEGLVEVVGALDGGDEDVSK